MQWKLISDHKVLTGQINNLIDFNHEEFQLKNHKDKLLKFPFRKFRYHQFNFL